MPWRAHRSCVTAAMGCIIVQPPMMIACLAEHIRDTQRASIPLTEKTNQGLREILTAPAFGGRRGSQEFFATIHIAAYAVMRPSPSRHKTSHEGRQPLAVLRAPWERPLRHRRLQTRCNERGSACRASPAAPILPPAAYLDSLRPLLLLARPSFQLVNLAPCQL